MAARQDILNYLSELLQPQLFRDYCPNGLQVEGAPEIKSIVCGVTANQALIDAAIAVKADTILVHHGYFWRGENPCVTGMMQKRLSTLLKNNINLLAYHLPLDAHETLGNNAQLANVLQLIPDGQFADASGPALGRMGRLETPMTGEQFAQHISQALDREPLHIPGGASEITRVAWCTGAAQDFITDVVDLNVDAYITGEVSERTVSIARETGIHFYAAGHHATERYGVLALGVHLSDHFEIDYQFIDIDNPV